MKFFVTDLLPANLKSNPLSYFCNAPELDVSSETFSFKPFSVVSLAAEISEVKFPSEKLLGKQAEFLFEHVLNQSTAYQLLASNVQIHGEEETLGELDYLVQDAKTEEVLHVELACKFYLLDKGLGSDLIQQWIGPNRKDRLIDKLEKLKSKQFPMLFAPETKAVLDSLAIAATHVEQQLCLKAFLFLPKGVKRNALPENFRKCVVGTYITPSEFTEHPTAQYAFPQKKEWLLPPAQLSNWYTYEDALVYLKKCMHERRSPLVYKKTESALEKFFVVWW